ncbi:MAG: hypothetical protein N3A38_03325, partial [Planctomycetota bacterium]|nr:hypothetical protein [Planctomycetota bacterium]
MSWWLAKLLGMERLEGGEVESVRLSFAHLQTPYHVLAFLAAEALLVWAVIFFYRREPAYCPRRRKVAMAAARILGLNILLLILAGPVLEIVKSGTSRSKVAVLLDVSESMSFRDAAAAGPEDRLRAAMLLGLTGTNAGGGSPLPPERERELAGASRLDLARGLLRHKEIGLIEKLREKYDVEVLTFARAADIAPVGSGDAPLPPEALERLKADGKCTELGRSLRAVVNRLKGQPVAALIPVTDGGSNKDEDPILVAGDIGVPIYPIGIGAPDARDIQVVYMFAEDVMFVEDSAPVYVRLRHRGYGGETVSLVVKRDGETIQERRIRLSEVSPEETVEVRISQKEKGTFEFRAEVPARPDEINADNNWKSQKIRVTDEKLRVLMVEGDPGWEFRFMKAALMRDRKRMDVKVIQRSADPDLAGRPGSEYLPNRGIPPREQLFKFDVIVIGNVKSDFFTKKDMENIVRFVQEEGGAVWIVAGPNHMPDGYKDTEIERLIP